MRTEQVERRLTGPGAPYELCERELNGRQLRVYRHAPPSLNAIYRKAHSLGDAILAAFENDQLSFRAAIEWGMRVAGMLKSERDSKSEMRFAIALENGPEWIAAFVGITSFGGTAVLLDPGDSPASIRQRLELSNCTSIVCRPELGEALLKLQPELRVITRIPGFNHRIDGIEVHSSLWSEGAESLEMDVGNISELAPDLECIIVFTSGTTGGGGKGVVLTHLNVVSGLMNMMFAGALANAGNECNPRRLPTRMPCALVHQSLSYIGGITPLLLALMNGGKVAILSRWDCARVTDLISREQITSLLGLHPGQLRELMAVRCELSSVVSMGVHGASLPPSLLDEIEAKWPHITVGTGYGLTETCGSISAISGAALRKYPRSTGRVVPTIEIRVAADDGTEVQEGQPGEIWLRSASLMKGYCRRMQGTQGLSDSWFRTGDIGTVSGDGQLHIMDRADNMLVVGEIAVPGTYLECVLLAQDEIVEAAVLQNPGQDASRSILVAVVPRTPQVISTSVLHALVLNSLSISAERIEIMVCGALPRNRSGKVDRAALLEMSIQLAVS